MDLGDFSISLAVRDLAASKAFYQKLGFEPVGGNEEANWLILQSGDATIGLYQQLFEKNTLTFNPTDAREVQRVLKERGVEILREAEEGEGPAHLMLLDPDGNPVLIDQH